MSVPVYVSLSAQIAADKRLATIAHNVANMTTPGFRAEEVRFSELLGEDPADRTSFVSDGETFTSLKAGPVNHTGNPLDLAVEGDGWFAVKIAGGTAYTRDGRLRMEADGRITTVTGAPVLDAGGAPLMIDPAGGAVEIGADGSIFQGQRAMGRIGIYSFPESARLTRHDNASVVPDKPAQLVQEFTRTSVRQGYVEGANVDPVMEMTRLISLQRAFEQAASAVSQAEDATTSAIRQLGAA